MVFRPAKPGLKRAFGEIIEPVPRNEFAVEQRPSPVMVGGKLLDIEYPWETEDDFFLNPTAPAVADFIDIVPEHDAMGIFESHFPGGIPITGDWPIIYAVCSGEPWAKALIRLSPSQIPSWTPQRVVFNYRVTNATTWPDFLYIQAHHIPYRLYDPIRERPEIWSENDVNISGWCPPIWSGIFLILTAALQMPINRTSGWHWFDLVCWQGLEWQWIKETGICIAIVWKLGDQKAIYFKTSEYPGVPPYIDQPYFRFYRTCSDWSDYPSGPEPPHPGYMLNPYMP